MEKLACSFAKTGRYVMAAAKDNYIPAFAKISIFQSYRKAIGIKIPGKAEVNTRVNLVTYDRRTFGAVPKAAVYALWLSDGNVPLPFDSTIDSEEADVTTAEKRAVDIRARGILLGHSDENGHLTCTFEKTGHYLVMAVRDDYIPGFARITIIPKNVINPGNVKPMPQPLLNSSSLNR